MKFDGLSPTVRKNFFILQVILACVPINSSNPMHMKSAMTYT